MLTAWTLAARIVDALTARLLWLLMRGTPASFLVSVSLTTWHALPLSTNPDMALVNGSWTVFAVSAMCYVVSRFRVHTASLLLAALLTAPPQKPRHLEAVPSPGAAATRSATRGQTD